MCADEVRNAKKHPLKSIIVQLSGFDLAGKVASSMTASLSKVKLHLSEEISSNGLSR